MDDLNGKPRARVGQRSGSGQKIDGPGLLIVRPSEGPQAKQDDEVVHIVLDTSPTGDGSGAKTAARWVTSCREISNASSGSNVRLQCWWSIFGIDVFPVSAFGNRL